MKMIAPESLSDIHGGCPCSDSCQYSAVSLLNHCSMDELYKVNAVFKSVLLSEQMAGADSATLKEALIEAIMAADI